MLARRSAAACRTATIQTAARNRNYLVSLPPVRNLRFGTSKRQQIPYLVRHPQLPADTALPAIEGGLLWDASGQFGEFDHDLHVDVMEDVDTGTMELAFDLPGMEKQDLKVEFHNGSLFVSGTREHRKTPSNRRYRSVERHFGTFSRVVYIGDDVNENDIKVSMKNGVLRITFPKSKKASAMERTPLNITHVTDDW